MQQLDAAVSFFFFLCFKLREYLNDSYFLEHTLFLYSQHGSTQNVGRLWKIIMLRPLCDSLPILQFFSFQCYPYVKNLGQYPIVFM